MIETPNTSTNPKDNPGWSDDNKTETDVDTELDTERQRGVTPGGRSPQGRPDDDLEGGRGSNEGGRGDPDDTGPIDTDNQDFDTEH